MTFVLCIIFCGVILPKLTLAIGGPCRSCLEECARGSKDISECASASWCADIYSASKCKVDFNHMMVDACYADGTRCYDSNPTMCGVISRPDLANPCGSSPASNTAKFYLHCDNQFWAHVSYDGGLPGTWKTIAQGDDWTKLNKFEVPNPTSQTLVDIWCQDNGGIGGFIATMSYNGYEYPTTNPFSAGNWEILGSTPSPPFSTPLTAVAASSLVYNAKGKGDWGSHFFFYPPHISSQAYWVWDGQVNNVLYFRVNFGRIIGNLVAINDPPPDFIKYDGLNTINDNTLKILLILIGVLVLVNILCMCYGKCIKSKKFEYSKVEYENTDSEAI